MQRAKFAHNSLNIALGFRGRVFEHALFSSVYFKNKYLRATEFKIKTVILKMY